MVMHSCVHSNIKSELLQLFGPSFTAENDITVALVARRAVIVPFGARPAFMAALQRDLRLYAAGLRSTTVMLTNPLRAFSVGGTTMRPKSGLGERLLI